MVRSKEARPPAQHRSGNRQVLLVLSPVARRINCQGQQQERWERQVQRDFEQAPKARRNAEVQAARPEPHVLGSRLGSKSLPCSDGAGPLTCQISANNCKGATRSK